MSRKEIIELEFPATTRDSAGVIIGARQTFVSTFLFYQALAYLGRSAVSSLAELERRDRRMLRALEDLGRRLDRVEVLVEDENGKWIAIGEFAEQGPIAGDIQVVPLKNRLANASRIRLRMVRGMWRIDFVAVASLAHPVKPQRIPVSEVSTISGRAAEVLERLRSGSGITTLPGEHYDLHYLLPEEFERQELFLETRGYYLEWMRREWLAEESRFRVRILFGAPWLAMRLLAPEFKKHEPIIEKLFWSSRYETAN